LRKEAVRRPEHFSSVLNRHGEGTSKRREGAL
jgi:hypothetical protein